MAEHSPTRCLLHQVLYQSTSPYGDPYAVTLMIDAAGNTHTALACSKHFGDLEKLRELEGREVNVLSIRGVLQLKPWAEQSLLEENEDGTSGQPDSSFSFDGLPDPRISAGMSTASTSSAAEGSCGAAIQELATTVAHLARDLQLPTAMWIHLP